MKNRIYSIYIALTLFLGIGLSSCSDYLDIVPKGEKIPTTLADFEALIRDEYTNHNVSVTQSLVLLNDKYLSSYYQDEPFWKANYFWDETANRIALNNSDEATYYGSYAAISTSNLIVEYVPNATESTESERNTLIAQAKVLRAMSYFVLANFYAETYSASTAADKLSVPLITSAVINAPYTQVSIQKIYDFMLNDVEEALPYLPETSATVLHPNLGTAYAFMARYYLQIGNYTEALSNANKALDQNSELFDWTKYYSDHQTQIENPDSYTKTPSPMGHDYIENYNFKHGGSTYPSSESSIPVARASMFEAGDARFASRWKLRTVGADTYYTSTLTGYFNYGGLTTTEVYLIKAECLARTGFVNEAMNVLNSVREKRILPGVYTPLSASDSNEALKYIIKTKCNEMILTIVPFADTRRWNLESNLARTLSKVVDGTTYSLSPNSEMWTMPFPQGAIDNPGNGSVKQNVTH